MSHICTYIHIYIYNLDIVVSIVSTARRQSPAESGPMDRTMNSKGRLFFCSILVRTLGGHQLRGDNEIRLGYAGDGVPPRREVGTHPFDRAL